MSSLAILVDAWKRAQIHTDLLFSYVAPEALYARAIGERNRVIFYIGHLEAFEWNLLGVRLFGLPAIDPSLDSLFAFGIDATGGNLPQDSASDWPTPKTTAVYVQTVRQRLHDAVSRHEASAASATPELGLTLWAALNVAVEHRWMHAETLTYMLHQLPLEHLRGLTLPAEDAHSVPCRRSCLVPTGVCTLGRKRDDPAFGWDNEYDETTLEVPQFAIDMLPVTQGDFCKFVAAGGYQNEQLWRPLDWLWVIQQGITQPRFWRRTPAGWRVRTVANEGPLHPGWPVYVSFAEAWAYSRFVGRALPSEAQWHRAAYGTPTGVQRAYPWGDDAPRAHHGNFGGSAWLPRDVLAHPKGASAFHVQDLVGNGWEWTQTPFAALPGFQPTSFYPGYSADFFDDNHYVLKGGSARTATRLLRRSFRNWFQPHYPYIYATFRCVESV